MLYDRQQFDKIGYRSSPEFFRRPPRARASVV